MRIGVLCLAASALASADFNTACAQTVSTPPNTTVQTNKPPAGPAKAAAQPPPPAAEEIVVTAERRRTNLQKTPIAATVLSQKDLLENGVTTIDQAAVRQPLAYRE